MRDPGTNLVIGRHRFKFVLMTLNKFCRNHRQPWAKPRLKKSERIYLTEEFWRDARHHPGRWFYKQIALGENGDFGCCVKVPQGGDLAPAGADLSPVVGNKQAFPARQREKRELHRRNGRLIFKDSLEFCIVPRIGTVIVREIQAHFHWPVETRHFHHPIKITSE